ncbi:MAG: 50S ribosomal protein L10 [Parcubacteria group bacterium GW2011_GWC2_42_13]|nr:MAG: 50S ribosomal protein L10 [Parcubacteria group bacterium GW2011_GWC2_42_13]
MTITRQKKEAVIKDLKDRIKRAKVAVFVNFHGLNVAKTQKLRKVLKKVGAEYLVAKKTLLRKALDDFDFSEERPNLEGEIGLVFGYEDEVSPPREIRDFSKAKEIRIIGGVLGKKYIDEAVIKTLAAIPTKDILLSHFARVVASPLQRLTAVLQAPLRDLVMVLGQIKK